MQSLSTSRLTWTVFSSSKDNLPDLYIQEAYKLGKMIGALGDHYCYGGYLGGLMGQVHLGVEMARQKHAQEQPSRIISIPYRHYYDAQHDQRFAEVHVMNTVGEQQVNLYRRADQLVALPGGIGSLAELWTTFEYLRCDPDSHHKTLWLINTNNCYRGFLQHMNDMITDGLARDTDFKQMVVVNSIDELKDHYMNGLQIKRAVRITGLDLETGFSENSLQAVG